MSDTPHVDAGRLDAEIAEILHADAAATHVPLADPADIERNLQDWTRMLQSLRRVIVTRPALVESMELQVQHAGIVGLVRVVGDPMCPPGQMYVIPDHGRHEGWAPRG